VTGHFTNKKGIAALECAEITSECYNSLHTKLHFLLFNHKIEDEANIKHLQELYVLASDYGEHLPIAGEI